MKKFSIAISALGMSALCSIAGTPAWAASSLSSTLSSSGSSNAVWNLIDRSNISTDSGPCASYSQALRAQRAKARQADMDGGVSSKAKALGSSLSGGFGDWGFLNPYGSTEGSSDGSSALNQAFNPFYNEPWQAGMPGQMPLLEGHTQAVSMVTGPGSVSETHHNWNVGGTDLGFNFEDPTGKTMLVFGDTMDCVSTGDGWRSNVILRTTDEDYSDGLSIDDALTNAGYATSGTAKEFISSRKDADGVGERTVIPTSGITINGTMYVDFMSVRAWNDNGPGSWSTNYAGTVKSTDGVNWFPVYDSGRMQSTTNTDTKTELGAYFSPWAGNKKASNSKVQMVDFVRDHEDPDTYVYRFSTPSGRYGSAILARALQSEFPKESAWEYYVNGQWVSGDTGLNNASSIFNAPVSELSIQWNDYLKKYVAMYLMVLDNKNTPGIVIRTADSLTGPWSEQRVLVDLSSVPQLYGSFMLPHQEGNTLYWVGTTWTTYNVILFKTNLDEALGDVNTASRPTSNVAGYDPRYMDGLKLNGFVDYGMMEADKLDSQKSETQTTTEQSDTE
ncbi:MAG: DUF4185 domain-containing protein [Corynebacterium sp.]|nr:DUF4185 domain-containing protein [Corynebacterium sp.]